MKTVELFAGTKSFSKVASQLGHDTLTIDNDKELNPDWCVDILKFNGGGLSRSIDLLWASPPCQGFSVAVIGRNWNKDRTPKTASAEMAMALVRKTMKLVDMLEPTIWFIENPRGMLRKMEWFDDWVKKNGGVRHTITYCQYGDKRMKPTDIWTNALFWKPRTACKNGMPCHEPAPRGSRTGTQGINGAKDRGRIPKELFIEIFNQLKKHETKCKQ